MTSSGRILVFASHFHPHIGGLECFSRELWKRFVMRGWAVRLVTSNTNNSPADDKIDEMEVFRLPVVSVYHERLPLPVLSPAFFRILRSALAPPPDLIVTNTRFFYTSVIGVQVGRRLHRPVLHIEHGSGFPDFGSSVATKGGEIFDRLVGGYVLRSADMVAGVSKAVNGFVRRLGATPTGVIYNGVDSALYRGVRRTLRDELGLTPSHVLVVFVGRLLEEKGILVLLDAFELLNGDSRIRLAILGDGPMGDAVRRRTQGHDRIHVLGFRNPKEVREALASADIFVHPSHYPEGLPTSVLEAAASGCAIVATPAGGTSEILDAPQCGILVAERNPAALAAVLTALADDEGLRTRLGAAAARRAAEVFEWDGIVQATELKVRSLIARNRAAEHLQE